MAVTAWCTRMHARTSTIRSQAIAQWANTCRRCLYLSINNNTVCFNLLLSVGECSSLPCRIMLVNWVVCVCVCLCARGFYITHTTVGSWELQLNTGWKWPSIVMQILLYTDSISWFTVALFWWSVYLKVNHVTNYRRRDLKPSHEAFRFNTLITTKIYPQTLTIKTKKFINI